MCECVCVCVCVCGVCVSECVRKRDHVCNIVIIYLYIQLIKTVCENE